MASWRNLLKIHPAAELFPRMSEADLEALAKDIKANGLKIPVTLWSPGHVLDGKRDRPRYVLDGINRLDAMELAEITIVEDEGSLRGQVTELYGARFETVYEQKEVDHVGFGSGSTIEPNIDPYTYVISANIYRRHLTAEQKRDLIAKLIKATPEKSDRQIAKTIKTDHKTVGAVRAKLEGRGEIPHVAARADSKGRQQPARKTTTKPTPTPTPKNKSSPEETVSDSASRNLRDDIAPDSNGECERLRVCNEELKNKNACLRRENKALRDRVAEVEAQLDDIPGFLDRTKEAAS